MENVGFLESETEQSPSPSSTKHPAESAGDDAPVARSLWESMTGIVGLGGADGVEELEGAVAAPEGRGLALREEEGDRVHVFSLATGHLYERFLKVRTNGMWLLGTMSRTGCRCLC